MTIKLFTVDAFADNAFSGNQAAVCLLQQPREDYWMQALAKEINYAETAFVTPTGDDFSLRWFTPAYEVDLCGHATLATSHVLWKELGVEQQLLRFITRSGELIASRSGDDIRLDFPSTPPAEQELQRDILESLGVTPTYCGMSRFDAFVVLKTESEVRDCRPDFEALAKATVRGVIVTAESMSDEYDFVSRFFAPSAGINEDPVTGSAHCCLAPYWATVLGQPDKPKLKMQGYQASKRGGMVGVELRGDRVVLSGKAITIIRGELAIEE